MPMATQVKPVSRIVVYFIALLLGAGSVLAAGGSTAAAAEPLLGNFIVSKEIVQRGDGNGDESYRKFDVIISYQLPQGIDLGSWTPPPNPTKLEVSGDLTSTSPQFPEGTVITLTEDLANARPAPVYPDFWAPEVFISNDTRVTISPNSKSAEFTIVAGETISIDLLNFPDYLYAFSVTVVAVGVDAADLVNKEFSFRYSCPNKVESGFLVKPDEETVSRERRFYPGATCTVEQDSISAHIDGYDLEPAENQDVVISATQLKKLVFTNIYTKHVKPQPPISPSPTNPETTTSSSSPDSIINETRKPGLPKAGD